MVASALIMDLAFNALGWIPSHHINFQAKMSHISINYTFWLNLAFGLVALGLVILAKRTPMTMQRAPSCCGGKAAKTSAPQVHAHHH
jgi:hypothetical protein